MSPDQVILLLAAAVTSGAPLIFAGIGEVLAERSGVLNLGLEGVMLVGAVAGFAAAVVIGNPWLAAATAMAAGGVLAAGHAFLTVTLGVEQVTTGLALALFGTGLSAFLGKPFVGIPNPVPFHAVPVPGLGDLPVLGRIFFRQDMLVYLSYILALAAWCGSRGPVPACTCGRAGRARRPPTPWA